jgi:P pilus assembly chaperone PapD
MFIKVRVKNLYTLALAIIAFLSPYAASAMSVEPMVVDLSSGGRSASQSFKVSNTGTKPLPIEAIVSALELGPNGEQKVEKAGDDLLIFPPQAMIPAGGSQVFRVQWIGEPDISKSRTYRVSVGQLPVKLPKGTSGIQIVMSFGVMVNVAPLQGKSDIVVMKAAPVKGKNGKRLAALTVKNPGNKHAYLQKSSIRLSGGGWSAEMTPGEIAQKVGLGIVQPGKERRFVLPVEVPGNISKIDATVKFRPEG